MKEYIDKNALKSAFEDDGHLSAYIEEMIDSCPVVDVAAGRMGRWVPVVQDDGYGDYVIYKCNGCGELVARCSRFCRNCGARME